MQTSNSPFTLSSFGPVLPTCSLGKCSKCFKSISKFEEHPHLGLSYCGPCFNGSFANFLTREAHASVVFSSPPVENMPLPEPRDGGFKPIEEMTGQEIIAEREKSRTQDRTPVDLMSVAADIVPPKDDDTGFEIIFKDKKLETEAEVEEFIGLIDVLDKKEKVKKPRQKKDKVTPATQLQFLERGSRARKAPKRYGE